MKNWEEYMIPGTSVLKNKFNISNLDELLKKEEEIVLTKLALLQLKDMKGNFDSNHLKAIHFYLFDEIYSFAGLYREVNMKKETEFVDFKDISKSLDDSLDRLNKQELPKGKFAISMYIADYYKEIIRIHPFREGNGRTAREFIRQLVNSKFSQYKLDFTKIDRKNFLLGVTNPDIYPSLVAFELSNALVEREKENTFHR